MKYFMIKYRFTTGSEAEWHQEIARFIAAIDSDPELSGKITYRSLKAKGGSDYYHIASAVDEHASKALAGREFFKRYKGRTDAVGAGTVEVIPLEVVAETEGRP